MKIQFVLATVLIALLAATAAQADFVTDVYAYAAADGSILGAVGVEDTTANTLDYPGGFSMFDKKNVPVFTTKMPPGISTQADLIGFDGRVAVFNKKGSINTHVFTKP